MLNRQERHIIIEEVKENLKKNYDTSYFEVEEYFKVVTDNWIKDLEDNGSHLTAEDIASLIFQIYSKYKD